jgi:hypothetical protein
MCAVSAGRGGLQLCWMLSARPRGPCFVASSPFSELLRLAVQVAVFSRKSDTEGHAPPAGSPLHAQKVFDLSESADADLHACAKEYVQLRKGMFQEAKAPAIEGADALLASLTGFALADDDIND